MAMVSADGSYATLADRLATFFDDDPAQSREIYQDTEIDQIANLLEQIAHAGFRCPRTYIVLRTIGELDVLERLLNEGFTDQWFPVELRGLPSFLSPSVKSRIVQSQGIVLTKSLDIESGRHRHFMPGETLPFEILGRLGSGGYGQVDRIVSKISFRQYALKRIRRRAAFGNNSKVAMKQFMSEIHTVKSLEHRHTVQYIGSYTDKTFLGLVMAPIADTDLASFMGQTCMHIQATTLASDESSLLRLRNQALASEMCSTLRTYFGCLAAALAYLHDRSIRHKDIKPQNILVHKGNVLLTDFGLSRDFTDDVGSTTSGITPASPRYSPPEVAMYEARNTSADIWSLGCVFLEMLAALHGYNTDWIKRYFAGVHTQATHFHANPDATSQLLQEWEATWTMLDKMPLLWTKEMLHMERQLRPTAARVFELVTSIDDSNQSSTNFCGICCILDDETDSNDSLLDDLTILAEPRSARVRADLRRTSLEHSHSAIAAIPVLQGGSSNTKSDETDHVRQDLALTSANQPVQNASTGENIQLNQSTSPEPALGEAIGRAKTHDLSVEGAAANRSAVIGVIGHDHEHQRVRSMMIEVSAPVDNPVSILEEKQPVEDSVYVQGEEPPVVGHTVSLSPSSSEYSIDSTKRPAISSHGRSEVFDKGASAKDMTMNVAETLSSSDRSLSIRRPLSPRSLALKDITAQGGGGSSTHIAELPTDSELFRNSSKPNSDDYDDTLPILSDFMDRKPGTFGAPPTYTEYKEGSQSFVIEAYDESMTKFTKKKAKDSQIDMSNTSSSVDGPAAQRSSTGSRSSSPRSKTKFRQDSESRSSPALGQRGIRRYFADLKKRFAIDVTTNNAVFGVALVESIPYAHLTINLFGEEGESYIYGYIPIVVGECGVFLKERGTEYADIITSLGNEEKVVRLITVFNNPSRYGKGLDWTGYSVRDASAVLHRYLRSLPKPLITPDFFQYMMFPPSRKPFRHPSSSEHQPLVARYQLALKRIPVFNRKLVLYLLDLFAVFAAKSDINGATTDVIVEYYFPVFFLEDKGNLELSKRQRFALGFMIDNQDNFVLGMGGRVKEAEASEQRHGDYVDSTSEAA